MRTGNVNEVDLYCCPYDNVADIPRQIGGLVIKDASSDNKSDSGSANAGSVSNHQLTEDKGHLQEAKGEHYHDTSLLNHRQLQFTDLPHRKDQDSDINGSMDQRRAKEELLILNGAVSACR
jgi:hypothetical protein